MNFGALIGEYASARAEVARAFAQSDEARTARAIRHHDVLHAEVSRRVGVLADYLASTPPPAEVAAAWNGRPAK